MDRITDILFSTALRIKSHRVTQIHTTETWQIFLIEEPEAEKMGCHLYHVTDSSKMSHVIKIKYWVFGIVRLSI